MQKVMLLLALAGLSSACTWVKVTDDGAHVAVSSPAHVQGCDKKRNVYVKVKDGLGPIDRNADKVATELATMARNEAVKFGGDTVVPTSAISDGSQEFAVYKCK